MYHQLRKIVHQISDIQQFSDSKIFFPKGVGDLTPNAGKLIIIFFFRTASLNLHTIFYQ